MQPLSSMLMQVMVKFEIFMLFPCLFADTSQDIVDLMPLNSLVQIREYDEVGHTSETCPKMHRQLFARLSGACAEDDQDIVSKLGLWAENLFSLECGGVGVSVEEGRCSRFGEEADYSNRENDVQD
jgi:hypothetical protein